MTIRSPIRWLGGKSVIAPWVISHLPPHHTYVEPFGGGAAVLLSKPRAKKEIYADLDERLVDLFREIRDNHEELLHRLMLTPYSRQLRDRCLGKTDPFSFFIASQQSFGGMVDKTAWGMVTTHSSHGMASTVQHYVRVIESLPHIAARLQGVRINRTKWQRSLQRYDSTNTLFYLDPPYVPSTRRDGDYDHEMSLADHVDLVKQVQKLRGSVVLSGYPNGLYAELEGAGWRRVDKRTACMVVARTKATGLKGEGGVAREQKRTESLWLNPATVRRLNQ